jgi:RimJ/RimL family protein N-acetyltransferase
MSLAYKGRVPPSAALAKSENPARAARQVKTKMAGGPKPKGRSKKPLAPAKKPGTLHAETFSATALNRKKERKKLAAGNTFPLPTERLRFRFWEQDDFAIAKQLWGDDRVTELLGGPFSVLPLGDLRKRARLKGASDEQMADVEAADDLEKKEKLVYLISECELAQAHLHAELSPCGAVQELRDQAVQLRLDAEITRQIEHGVQLYPVFLLDPIPEMLTPGAGNIGCVGLRQKDIATWLDDVEHTFGSGITSAYEIAFHIRPPYWRRGLATEAAGAVLDHAFMRLNAGMVTASCEPDNVAAQQLLRKLGFQYAGIDMYPEHPTAVDEKIDQLKQSPPEEERGPQSRPHSNSSRRSVATPMLALELAPEPEPEPELNSGLGLTGMFGWGSRRPTYVMLRSEHADRIDAEKDFPAVQRLFETMVGIGEGSEFHLRRQIREERWTLRDLQRRVQRAGIPPESEAYQQAMAADDAQEGIVQLLVDNSLYHTKVQIMQVVTNATNALCSQLCMYLKNKLLDDDVNNRHRTLLVSGGTLTVAVLASFSIVCSWRR